MRYVVLWDVFPDKWVAFFVCFLNMRQCTPPGSCVLICQVVAGAVVVGRDGDASMQS